MKARNSVLASALASVLFWAFACDSSTVCKADADCPAQSAFCYAGKNPKPGIGGVCVRTHTIHSFEPLEAPHGKKLYIRGSDFFPAPSLSVTLNGVPAEIFSVSSNEIVVYVPKNLNCSGPIEVTIGHRVATSATDFSYIPTVTVSTFAGDGPTGEEGGGFRDGPSEEALFDEPWGLAIDLEDNLYVADSLNDRIRKISKGMVSTLAGKEPGYQNGQGTEALFDYPTGIAFHPSSGNLFVVDSFNGYIREITPSGEVSTFAGEGQSCSACWNEPSGIAIDPTSGNFYVADSYNHRIIEITPEKEVSTFAGSNSGNSGVANGTGEFARFNGPDGIAIDTKGNLYVSDYLNHCIRKITPKKEVSAFAGKCGMHGNNDGLANFARFYYPAGIAFHPSSGNLYVSDFGNDLIRRISPEGKVSTLAGTLNPYCALNDGPGAQAQFCGPDGIAIDKEGNLYVADAYHHRIRKIVLE